VAAAAAEIIVKTEIQVPFHRVVVVVVAQVEQQALATAVMAAPELLLLDIKKAPKGAFYLVL